MTNQTWNFELGYFSQHWMEQSALKNVNNCLNANIYSYLETSGGKSHNLIKDMLTQWDLFSNYLYFE